MESQNHRFESAEALQELYLKPVEVPKKARLYFGSKAIEEIHAVLADRILAEMDYLLIENISENDGFSDDEKARLMEYMFFLPEYADLKHRFQAVIEKCAKQFEPIVETAYSKVLEGFPYHCKLNPLLEMLNFITEFVHSFYIKDCHFRIYLQSELLYQLKASVTKTMVHCARKKRRIPSELQMHFINIIHNNMIAAGQEDGLVGFDALMSKIYVKASLVGERKAEFKQMLDSLIKFPGELPSAEELKWRFEFVQSNERDYRFQSYVRQVKVAEGIYAGLVISPINGLLPGQYRGNYLARVRVLFRKYDNERDSKVIRREGDNVIVEMSCLDGCIDMMLGLTDGELYLGNELKISDVFEKNDYLKLKALIYELYTEAQLQAVEEMDKHEEKVLQAQKQAQQNISGTIKKIRDELDFTRLEESERQEREREVEGLERDRLALELGIVRKSEVAGRERELKQLLERESEITLEMRDESFSEGLKTGDTLEQVESSHENALDGFGLQSEIVQVQKTDPEILEDATRNELIQRNRFEPDIEQRRTLRTCRPSRLKTVLVSLLGDPIRIQGSHHVFRGKNGRTCPINLVGTDGVSLGVLRNFFRILELQPAEIVDKL